MILLFMCSVVVALWYKEAQTITVCEPNLASGTLPSYCSATTVQAFTYVRLDSSRLIPPSIEIPLGIGADLFVCKFSYKTNASV